MTCEVEVRHKSSKDNECTCRYASNERMRRGEEGKECLLLMHCSTAQQHYSSSLKLCSSHLTDRLSIRGRESEILEDR